jgi:hypothetical protein
MDGVAAPHGASRSIAVLVVVLPFVLAAGGLLVDRLQRRRGLERVRPRTWFLMAGGAYAVFLLIVSLSGTRWSGAPIVLAGLGLAASALWKARSRARRPSRGRTIALVLLGGLLAGFVALVVAGNRSQPVHADTYDLSFVFIDFVAFVYVLAHALGLASPGQPGTKGAPKPGMATALFVFILAVLVLGMLEAATGNLGHNPASYLMFAAFSSRIANRWRAPPVAAPVG